MAKNVQCHQEPNKMRLEKYPLNFATTVVICDLAKILLGKWLFWVLYLVELESEWELEKWRLQVEHTVILEILLIETVKDRK